MGRPALRDLALVLAISWIARAVVIAAIGDAHSLDVEYWKGALGARAEGTNPYETGVLNWPPLWLDDHRRAQRARPLASTSRS